MRRRSPGRAGGRLVGRTGLGGRGVRRAGDRRSTIRGSAPGGSVVGGQCEQRRGSSVPIGRPRPGGVPVAGDLLEAVDHPARGGVLGVDLERCPRRGRGAGLVAALQRDARQADRGDPVAGSGSSTGVDLLGLVEQPEGERALGVEEELDHGGPPARTRRRRTRPRPSRAPAGSAAAPRRDLARDRQQPPALVAHRVGEDPLQELVEQPAHGRSGRQRQLGASGRRRRRRGRRARATWAATCARQRRAQLVEAARVRREAAADVVGRAQVEQLVEVGRPTRRMNRRIAASDHSGA